VKLGFCADALIWLDVSRSQFQLVIFATEVSLNWTKSGAKPDAGDAVKFGTGRTGPVLKTVNAPVSVIDCESLFFTCKSYMPAGFPVILKLLLKLVPVTFDIVPEIVVLPKVRLATKPGWKPVPLITVKTGVVLGPLTGLMARLSGLSG